MNCQSNSNAEANPNSPGSTPNYTGSQNTFDDIFSNSQLNEEKKVTNTSLGDVSESSDIQFILQDSHDNIIMTSLEHMVVSFIYSIGKRVTYSTVLSNQKLRMREYICDQSLSIDFFLTRPYWFKVQMYFETDKCKIDYIIDLINLIPKLD